MNINKILVMAVSTFLAASSVCFANDVVVTQDIATSKISINVTTDENFAGKRLMMYSMQKGVSIKDIETADSEVKKTDKINALGSGEVDENGEYTFSDVALNGENGEYIFYVTVAGENKVLKSEPFYAVTLESVNSFVEKMQNAEADKVLEVLDEEVSDKTLKINIRLFENLNEDGKAQAAQALELREFDGIKDLITEINRASVKAGIDNAEDAQALDMLLFPGSYDEISEFLDIINAENDMDELIENSAIKVLSGFDTDERTEVFAEAVNLDTDETLIDKIVISVLNSEFVNADGYGDITDIIKLHKSDVLKELNFNKYNSSKHKNSLNKELLDGGFESVKDLVSFIEDYLDDAGNSSSGSSGSSSGGSSSKGNKTSSTVISPSLIAGQTETKPKTEESEKISVFSDLKGYDWAFEAITHLEKMGIVSGKGNNCFDPAGYVTREEFVKILVGALEIEVKNDETQFNDVASGAWYAPYIATAVKAGIVNGISSDSFGTGANISRQDVATMVVRALNAVTDEENTQFDDNNDIALYARPAVAFMYEKGYISGYGDGNFKPKNFCTRAEAAKIIYGILN